MTKASHSIVSNGIVDMAVAILLLCGCKGSLLLADTTGNLLADAACSASVGAPAEACGAMALRRGSAVHPDAPL